MHPDPTEQSRLQIRRVQAQYHVSSAHPAPERLKARLDEAVTHSLAQTLSTMCSAWFADTDPSIWLIRRLEINVDVSAAWDRESLARAWRGQIARALSRAMQDGEDGENVLRFPNRAAFLARFLIDVAEGHAWGKWYYESFAGLRLLPTSAALRTAILDRPAIGQEALLELSTDALQKTLGALTTQDARTIVDRLAATVRPAMHSAVSRRRGRRGRRWCGIHWPQRMSGAMRYVCILPPAASTGMWAVCLCKRRYWRCCAWPAAWSTAP